MIEFREVHKSFGVEPVLQGVDLIVREGETLVLLGESGSGKSVLLKHAIGLLEPDRGDVLVDGSSLAKASVPELGRIRQRVGYVFQNAALFDSLSVAENLYLALDTESDGTGSKSLRREAAELLRRVNLDAVVLDQLPSELSGGMRKRVGVARAIANRPHYLLYDEPTTGLDPVNAENVDSLIIELKENLGVTGIVVTHDLDSAFEVGDRIALLANGRIRACGTPAEVLASTDSLVQQFVSRRRSRAVAVA